MWFSKSGLSIDQKEVYVLRKEVTRLELEKEILKRAQWVTSSSIVFYPFVS